VNLQHADVGIVGARRGWKITVACRDTDAPRAVEKLESNLTLQGGRRASLEFPCRSDRIRERTAGVA
jgi:hypothetical protein